jgi:hypothetical protein
MAGPYLFNNHAVTTLDGGITDVATSLNVNAGDGALFPASNFKINIGTEVIFVGSRSTDAFSSLTRGYDGTTAAAHSDEDTIINVASAEEFNQVPRNSVTDFIYRRPSDETPHAYDDEFDNGTTLDPAWVEVNPSGTANWSQDKHVLSANFFSQASADMAGLVKPLDSLTAPLTITTRYDMAGSYENYQMYGLAFAAGTAVGDIVLMAMPYMGSSNNKQLSLYGGTWNNFNNAPFTEDAIWGSPTNRFIRLIWTAANTFKAQISPNGIDWTDYGHGAKSFTMTPTHFGFGVSRWGGGTEVSVASYDFFRVDESDDS